MADESTHLDEGQIEGLQIALQHCFTQRDLLTQALTHASFGNEMGLSSEQRSLVDNERLEFLGDAVLELTVSRWIYSRWPNAPEGRLTQLRASVVRAESLATVARRLNLGELLRLGVGEERTGGRDRQSILADALEAVIGAIFLDAGFDAAMRSVKALFGERIRTLDEVPAKGPKTRLQEWSQATHQLTPTYSLLGASGPEHDARFEAEVIIGDVVRARGIGRSKKAAQKQAAELALQTLEDDG